MLTITLLGVPEPEAQRIQRVLIAGQARGLPYALSDNPAAAGTRCVIVVNADDSTAARAWQALKRARDDLAGISVSAQPDVRACSGDYTLRRPILGLELIRALQEIAASQSTQVGQVATRASDRLGEAMRASSRARPEMPARATDTPEQARAARPRRRGSGQFSGRALVVDDSATIRRQLQLVLGDQGVEVEVAHNGELALQLLSTREFDIVLLDVVLPGADGYQICKAIKRSRTRRPPPVVMLTSRSSPFDRARGSLAGCDGYITKPASLARIKEAVARYLAPAGNVRIDTAAP